jgi:methionyl aminopeptidase
MARKVSIKSAADIDMARKAGALAAEVLHMIAEHVRPGVTTDELDRICHNYIVNVQKAIPANVGYHGFPKTICASANHVICHGIPSAKVLKNGDILNIDVAVIKDGWFGDTSRMYYVGQPSPLARRLVETTYEATRAGIMAVPLRARTPFLAVGGNGSVRGWEDSCRSRPARASAPRSRCRSRPPCVPTAPTANGPW